MEEMKDFIGSEEEQYPLEVKGKEYRARFVAWLGLSKTSLFVCSDGKNRYICTSKITEGGEPVV